MSASRTFERNLEPLKVGDVGAAKIVEWCSAPAAHGHADRPGTAIWGIVSLRKERIVVLLANGRGNASVPVCPFT
jgi:hypothetical protein